MQQNNNPMPQQYDDEIDLFELFQALWQQKWLILGTTLVVTILAYVFTAVYPLKKDFYQSEALIEIASVYNEGGTKTVQPIESSEDLVQIVQQKFSVDASVPRQAEKLIQLKTNASTAQEANQQMTKVVSWLQQRHAQYLKPIDTSRVISSTQPVGEPETTLKSPKEKLKLILAVAIVLGGMLGVFIALIRSAIKKRKAQTA